MVPIRSGDRQASSNQRRYEMCILSLGIVGGTDIKIIADGSDEQVAVNSLVELVESGFSD